MRAPFCGFACGGIALKKGAVPVEHSDATSLNEEFNAETAPGTGWRTRPVDAAQTCVPFPYGAGAQDQILEVRPRRQDLLAATERRDLLFCTARPGVRLHAGAAETYRFRPAPNRERVQSAGTEIIRMDGRTQRGFIDSCGLLEMRPG